MDRLEELRQKIENSSDLSLDEIKALELEIAEVFKQITEGQVEGIATDDIEVLTELYNAQQSVREVGVGLQAKADEADAKIAEMSAVVLGDAPKAEGETEGEETPETPAEEPAEETPAETPVEETPAEAPAEAEVVVPEAVAAAASTKAPLTALNSRIKKHQQAAAPAPIRTKSRDITFTDQYGVPTDMKKYAESMIDRRDKFPEYTAGDVSERITMGRFQLDLSEDFKLSNKESDEKENTEKIEALIAGAMSPDTWQDQSLTASGGWCAPLDTVYAIETVAGTQRPVRDSFPRMAAGRGGIRFRKGLSFATGHALSATGVWLNSTDQTPGGNTKNVGTVNCDTITEVTTDAIYRQLKFGNFRGRADVEGVAAWTGLIASDWAATAEVHLLDALVTNSTATTTSQHLGLARDFLDQVIRYASTYRNRNRMGRDSRVRVVLPSWVPDAIVTDLMLSQAAEQEFFTWNAQTVIAMLNAQNINVTLYEDSPTGAGMQYSAGQTTWKSTAVWFLFHEGAYVFLDSGTLDLGLVRDSTLNGKNDYELFAENFEALAFVGVESQKVTTNICVSGTAALAKDNSAICIS